MKKPLAGTKVAVLVTDGFEQVEMTSPKEALEAAGADVTLVFPDKSAQGWHHNEKAKKFSADRLLKDAKPGDYDALVLPGGVKNPDSLRLIPKAISFIKAFGKRGKPIAAICHGPWTLINAELVSGKTLTSWPSLKVDLQNAGARWVNKEVVVSDLLVTSRKPADLKAFNKAMIGVFSRQKQH